MCVDVLIHKLQVPNRNSDKLRKYNDRRSTYIMYLIFILYHELFVLKIIKFKSINNTPSVLTFQSGCLSYVVEKITCKNSVRFKYTLLPLHTCTVHSLAWLCSAE